MEDSAFVNGRERAVIKEEMGARISRNDMSLEREENIKVRFP